MRWFISAIVALVLVASLWWMEQRRQAELVPEADVELPAESEQPEPRYPLPEPEPQPIPAPEEPSEDETRESELEPQEKEPDSPLPDLADSDVATLETLSELLGDEFVQRWIKPEFVVSRTVSLVNSLEGDAPALKSRSVRTLETEPLTREVGDGDALLWTEANAARYRQPIAALESLPPQEAARLYRRYHPLFQQAWEQMGETEPYFNDRLIDIIDHLLATPEVELPFEAVPYEGQLQFADEALEEASWGRKLLIRMGPENARTVKEWLRQFRNAVTGNTETSQPSSRG